MEGNVTYLNTRDGTEYKDSTVQNSQCTLDFNGEIDVTGRIDNIDRKALFIVGNLGTLDLVGRGGRDPITECRSRLDRDSLFAL